MEVADVAGAWPAKVSIEPDGRWMSPMFSEELSPEPETGVNGGNVQFFPDLHP